MDKTIEELPTSKASFEQDIYLEQDRPENIEHDLEIDDGPPGYLVNESLWIPWKSPFLIIQS